MTEMTPAFENAARVILRGIEDAFEISPITEAGRDRVLRTIVNVLGYYCLPKNGPTSIEDLREQVRLLEECATDTYTEESSQ